MNAEQSNREFSHCTGPVNGHQHMLLTVDVEDWFQVENFRDIIHPSSWPTFEPRVERNTHRLLELFSEIRLPSSNRINSGEGQPDHPIPDTRYPIPDIKATFFILGWIAERMPGLVREISAQGHEVASHGYNHELTGNVEPKDLKRDLEFTKSLLEDIIGGPVYGYRAPSFSISADMLKIVEDCGYLYDSSYNSFSANSRYGRADFNGNGNVGIAKKISEGFYEIPISNIEWAGMVLPAGGGGYFRLYPLHLFILGARTVLQKHGAYMFYMHPWEIDPEQPRVDGASSLSRFRHYVNLGRTLDKLRGFIGEFNDCAYPTCSQYLCGC
jgi:polysaccharide deacetylase family protein (PEP-CTERM system associated)